MKPMRRQRLLLTSSQSKPWLQQRLVPKSPLPSLRLLRYSQPSDRRRHPRFRGRLKPYKPLR
ncbi:MAG: hypothetical protein NZT92_07990 [Abditibacteriales bacterium]|nr:hypothetical protein [Abditibacteriales bacterium]MDW8365913.1 hypothetical protein [Abditibacteriales bacterium]